MRFLAKNFGLSLRQGGAQVGECVAGFGQIVPVKIAKSFPVRGHRLLQTVVDFGS